VSGDNPFEGKVFAASGILSRRSQDEVRIHVEIRGGVFKTAATKKTNFLIVGAKPGDKAEKARAMGIAILDEEQFEAMLASVPVTQDMKDRYLS